MNLQGFVQIQTVGIELRYSPGNYPRLSPPNVSGSSTGRSGAESRNPPEKAIQIRDSRIRRNDAMVDIRWFI